jgi:peptide/nickel transport system permease protein
MNMTPGDPAMMILGEGAPAEALAAKRAELGFNSPFIIRYFHYLLDAFRGNFGHSYRTGIPVVSEIQTRIGYTVLLSVISICLAVLIGLPIGIVSAVKQYSITDQLSIGISLIVTSMPGFFMAMLLILMLSLKLGLLPPMGVNTWVNFIMPSIALSSSTTASLIRMTRSTMLEVIRQDYIRTARAKGASERLVVYHHALRNALLPVVTVIGVNFGQALGGAIAIEQVFAIPGIGQLMINSIRQKDMPMVMAAVIFAAFIASMINLLVDLLYSFIDPRLSSQFSSKKQKVKG